MGKSEIHEVQIKDIVSTCTLNTSAFYQLQTSLGNKVMLCNAPHCRAWPLLMNTNGMQQLQGRDSLNTASIVFSCPRSQLSEKQSPAFLLTPLLPDQIRFLAVMLPLLGYLFRFFCSCATIKWNIFRASQQSHYCKSLLLLLAFFLHVTLKEFTHLKFIHYRREHP